MEEAATVKVDVNGKEAEDKMRELIDLTIHWKKALEEAMRIKDPKAIKEAEKNLKLATKATKELEKQMFDVNKVLKNLSGASLHDLKKAQRELNKELSSPAIKRNSKEWNELTGKLRRVKGELGKVRKEMYATSRGANKVKIGLQNIGAALGIAGGVYMLINAFKNFINISKTFEKALSSLSAITGATGEDLNYLKQQAILLSKQTLQSATDIVKAYELIGSQRPELLKNTVALAEVTKQAVILSEATGGKLGLVDSAKSVTTVMNQMEQSVDQAGRIINVLAAGSKVGSANVLYLSEVYEKAGTSAMLMKISVEQLAGATEAIAPFYSQASMAGNSFDKVLLKLKEKQIGYTDGVFDLNDAIDELRQRYNDGETATQIFGVEHAKLGELLVLNQEKMNKYTEAVTGTTIALEQQKTQNNNLDGALTQLGNSVDTFMIKLNRSNAGLAENVRFITALVNSYSDIDAVFSKKGIIEGMLTFKETLKEINDEKAKEDAKLFDSDGIVKDSAVAKRSIKELDVELQKITDDASMYLENWKNKTGDEKAFWAGQYDIAKQNIDLIGIAVAAKKNLLAAGGDGEDGEVPIKTVDEFIAANKKEFEVWKEARKVYLDDQALYELEQEFSEERFSELAIEIAEREKRKAEVKKNAQAKYEEAFMEEFAMPEEEEILESPELVQALLTSQYELEMWMESYEGRVNAYDEMLAKNQISKKEHDALILRLDKEVTNGKIENAQKYFQAASQLAGALSNFYVSQMNQELANAEGNEQKQEAIRKEYAVKQQNMAMIQAVVQGALGIVKTGADLGYPLAIPFQIVQGLATLAQIAVIKGQQFKDGRYPVSAQDGNTYNARMYGKPTTTEIVKGPALVSEIEDEMIIDGPTTRNLVFNYPDIVEGIKQLSMGGTPQFAEGRYPVSTTTDTETEGVIDTTQADAMLLFVEAVNRLVDEGVLANLITDEDYYRTHQEGEKEYNDFQQQVN
ncbi:MAG: phage tail tape measure protein [Bacteroidota bacterium]